MKKYFIITGASSGIGKALAEVMLDEHHVLFLISRTEHTDISNKAIARKCQIHSICYDLSDLSGIEKLFSSIFDHIDPANCQGIYLVNNAAVTEPIKPIDKIDPSEIIANLNVNYLSVVLLTSLFIRLSEKFPVDRQILNITSGAASIPHHGLSLYCSAKAAMDHFTRCVGVEQKSRTNPVKIHALAPGFVDTPMLRGVLTKSTEDFASRPMFEDVIRSGRALDPTEVAGKIYRLWMKGRFKPGEVSSLGEY